jgi:hypothetical protein
MTIHLQEVFIVRLLLLIYQVALNTLPFQAAISFRRLAISTHIETKGTSSQPTITCHPPHLLYNPPLLPQEPAASDRERLALAGFIIYRIF